MKPRIQVCLFILLMSLSSEVSAQNGGDTIADDKNVGDCQAAHSEHVGKRGVSSRVISFSEENDKVEFETIKFNFDDMNIDALSFDCVTKYPNRSYTELNSIAYLIDLEDDVFVDLVSMSPLLERAVRDQNDEGEKTFDRKYDRNQTTQGVLITHDDKIDVVRDRETVSEDRTRIVNIANLRKLFLYKEIYLDKFTLNKDINPVVVLNAAQSNSRGGYVTFVLKKEIDNKYYIGSYRNAMDLGTDEFEEEVEYRITENERWYLCFASNNISPFSTNEVSGIVKQIEEKDCGGIIRPNVMYIEPGSILGVGSIASDAYPRTILIAHGDKIKSNLSVLSFTGPLTGFDAMAAVLEIGKTKNSPIHWAAGLAGRDAGVALVSADSTPTYLNGGQATMSAYIVFHNDTD